MEMTIPGTVDTKKLLPLRNLPYVAGPARCEISWLQPIAAYGPAGLVCICIRVSIHPNLFERQAFATAALRDGRHDIVNDFLSEQCDANTDLTRE